MIQWNEDKSNQNLKWEGKEDTRVKPKESLVRIETDMVIRSPSRYSSEIASKSCAKDSTIMIDVGGGLASSEVGKRAMDGGIIDRTMNRIKGRCKKNTNKQRKRRVYAWNLGEYQHLQRPTETELRRRGRRWSAC